MEVQQLLTYIFLYGIPAGLLFGLACIIILNNHKLVEHKIISILFIVYSVIYLLEFSRHLLPIEMSAFLVTYFLDWLTILCLSLMLHLAYVLVFKNQKAWFSSIFLYLPLLFYVIVIISGLRIETEAFVSRGIWYYHSFAEFDLWILAIMIMVKIVTILFLYYGMKMSKSDKRKRLIKFLLVFTAGFFCLFFLISFYLDFSSLPPNFIVYHGAVTAICLAIGITRYELLPSISRRYEVMFNLTPTSILVVDGKLDILEMNNHAKEFLGVNKSDNLLDYVHSSSNKKQLLQLMSDIDEKGVLHNYVIEFKGEKQSSQAFVEVEATASKIGKNTIYYLVWRDVTKEREHKAQISHLAYHDSLTGLHNRAYFVPIAKELIENVGKQASGTSALVLLDLNFFKQINDTYGHSVGDLVLQHTANILKSFIFAPNLLARLGGDEFILYFDYIQNEEELIEKIEEIRHEFEVNLFKKDDITIRVYPGSGYCIVTEQMNNYDDVYHEADVKMYEDKAKTKALKQSRNK